MGLPGGCGQPHRVGRVGMVRRPGGPPAGLRRTEHRVEAEGQRGGGAEGDEQDDGVSDWPSGAGCAERRPGGSTRSSTGAAARSARWVSCSEVSWPVEAAARPEPAGRPGRG